MDHFNFSSKHQLVYHRVPLFPFIFVIIKVTLTDKQNHINLIYWSFIQHCYMFRLSKSAIIR